jgi:hypothetical protein
MREFPLNMTYLKIQNLIYCEYILNRLIPTLD